MTYPERARNLGSSGPVIWTACMGAALMTSGVQGIAPAIPAIAAQFSLDSAQVALITSVYLLPSVVSAFISGVLADRFGSRPVFAGALLLFGLGGLLLLAEHSLFALFAVRLVQGVAFGAVMSLSVAIIGDLAPSGAEAARGQSRRVVSISATESVMPVVGGFLVSISWYAPFVMQLLALPCAVLAWRVLPPAPRRRGERAGSLRVVLHAPALISVQLLGALRFVFKFAVVTYFPVLAVDVLRISPAKVGIIMGAAAFLTALGAWFTQRLTARRPSSQVIGGCLVTSAAGLCGLAVAGMLDHDLVVLATGALLVFGFQDGVFGVAHNVLITDLSPPGARSAYVGLSGTVRNVGKFAAPMVFGAATLAFTVAQSFLAMAGIGLVSLPAAYRAWLAESRRLDTDGRA